MAGEQDTELREQQSARPEGLREKSRSRLAEEVPPFTEWVAEQAGDELSARRQAVPLQRDRDDDSGDDGNGCASHSRRSRRRLDARDGPDPEQESGANRCGD